MRILLVNANRDTDLSPIPIGLAFISNALKKYDHEVEFTDLMRERKPQKVLLEHINKFKPDFTGFSIRNLDNLSITNNNNPVPELKEIVHCIKDKNTRIILGGTAFSLLPRQFLTYLEADYGIIGQGENSIIKLLDAVSSNTSFYDIEGLVFWDNGKVAVNLPEYPGYSGVKCDYSIIDFNKYKKVFPPVSIGIVTKTGCPFNCDFCPSGKSVRSNCFQPRSIDEIIDDITYLSSEYKIQNFNINDYCFNATLDFAKSLFNEIIKRNLKINITATLKPIKNSFDMELFELYKKAGGEIITIGFDSISEKMIDGYKLPFNLDDIIKFTEFVNQINMPSITHLLFGGPGETYDTINESLSFLSKIKNTVVNYGLGIRIFPYTSLFNQALNEGVISSEDELLLPQFYLSKEIEVEKARKIIDRAVNKYSYRHLKLIPYVFRKLTQ